MERSFEEDQEECAESGGWGEGSVLSDDVHLDDVIVQIDLFLLSGLRVPEGELRGMLEQQMILVEDLHGLYEPREETKHFGIRIATDEEVLIELALKIHAVIPRDKVHAVLFFDHTDHAQPP